MFSEVRADINVQRNAMIIAAPLDSLLFVCEVCSAWHVVKVCDHLRVQIVNGSCTVSLQKVL